MQDWQDLQGNNVNDFITNYRKSLEEQRDAGIKQIEQERNNAFTGLMTQANRRGLMYSNFPARQKIKYDTQSYYPAIQKNQQTYQTALDTLRSNALKYYNNIQELKQATDELNAEG